MKSDYINRSVTVEYDIERGDNQAKNLRKVLDGRKKFIAESI